MMFVLSNHLRITEQSGLGFEEWPDGARFEGSYENGKKNGIQID
jgi:hypothetical protein